MDELDEGIPQQKDYNGRNPMVIPVPKIAAQGGAPAARSRHYGGETYSARGAGNSGLPQSASVMLNYALKTYFYAFHETGRSEDGKSITLAHDLHPDVHITFGVSGKGNVDLKSLRQKIDVCNLALRKKSEEPVLPPAQITAPPKETPAFIPVPHFGRTATESLPKHWVRRQETEQTAAREYVEKHYIRPAGFRFDCEYARIEDDITGDGFDGWLYKHNKYPDVELIVPHDKSRRVSFAQLEEYVTLANHQLTQIYHEAGLLPEVVASSGHPLFARKEVRSLEGESFHIQQYENDAQIWLDDITTIRHRMKLESPHILSNEELEVGARALAKSLEHFAARRKKLCEDYGFSVRTADRTISLSHPFIDSHPFDHFSSAEPLMDDQIDTYFDNLQDRIIKKRDNFIQRLDALGKNGLKHHYQEEPEQGYAICRMPEDEQVAFIPTKGIHRVPAVDTYAITISHTPALKEKSGAEPLDPDAAKSYSLANLAARPLDENSKVVLVFDASALFDLRHGRGEGRSFLDLVRLASEMPSVHRIMIPSLVADLEVGGYIPSDWMATIRTPYGDGSRRIDGLRNEALQEFLSHVSRMYVDENGKQHIYTPLGGTDKICIWWSSSQARLYQKLKSGEISGKNLQNQGEDACKMCATTVTSEHPVKIVLSDRRHVTREDEDFAKGKSPRTVSGMGVGIMHTYNFVSGLFDTAEGRLTTMLHKRYGGPRHGISKERLIDAINSGEGFRKLSERTALEDVGINADNEQNQPWIEYAKFGMKEFLKPQKRSHVDGLIGGKGDGELPPH